MVENLLHVLEKIYCKIYGLSNIINKHYTEPHWEEIFWRVVILLVLGALGIFWLVLKKKIDFKHIWTEVISEINISKDVFFPLIIVLLVNLVELLIYGKGLGFQTFHIFFEIAIVLTTVISILVYEFYKIDSQLKNEGEFWKQLNDKLAEINSTPIIGFHMTDLKNMFEPAGLKYFQTTLTVFNQKKVTYPNLRFYRILLIHDYKEDSFRNTWVANAITKYNKLTKTEQFLKLYKQIHKENGIDLFLITQAKLHKILVELKSYNLNENQKNELLDICPCDKNCKKIKIDKLDGLIFNNHFYITSNDAGIKFEEKGERHTIAQFIASKITADNTYSIESLS